MDKEKLINGYFEDSLTQDQLDVMNELLKTDADFSAEFKFQKEVQEALKKNERKAIKEGFSSLTISPEKEPKVIRMHTVLMAASIAAIIGLASFFFVFKKDPINTENLYADNFTIYENVVHPIERGQDSGRSLEDPTTSAFYAYENEEYDAALQLFEELNVKQNDSYIDFYKAIILMQLNKQEEAIPLLKNYIAKEGELVDRAIWYLALAYLKVKEIDNSKAQLQVLKNKGGFKQKAAENLLNKLK